MLVIQAKGLGRYRIEDQKTGFVLNFLNPKGFTWHLQKVLKMSKAQITTINRELAASGKCKVQRAA